MIKYLLPILFTVLTATHRDLIPSVLLFHLDQSANDLKIFNSNQQLVDNDILNQILLKNNVSKIEKWIEFASKEDQHNGIHFSRIYRIHFDSDKYNLSEIKLDLESLNPNLIDLIFAV